MSGFCKSGHIYRYSVLLVLHEAVMNWLSAGLLLWHYSLGYVYTVYVCPQKLYEIDCVGWYGFLYHKL